MQIKKHDKSHLVQLRDGSAWRIWPGDIPKTLQWLPTTEIDVADIDDEICSHALIDRSSGSRVRVISVILDMSGSVVGVVVAQLNLAKSNPQNVNFAIQPSMVINFLEVKDVTPKIDTPKAQRSSTEVCEIAKKFTVRVYCQGISPKTTESAGPVALSPSDVADFGTKFDVQATPEQGSTRP